VVQDGVIHPTFRSALYARGLASDDSDIIATMFEIVGVETSLQSIRRHFARILVHNPPHDASRLFHMFAADMSDGDVNDAQVMAATLWGIEDLMLTMGRSLAHADYGIVLPPHYDDDDSQWDGRRLRPRHALPDHLSAAAATIECERLTAMFTAEQTAGYHLILETIHSNNPSSVFTVLASGGTGKTLFANGLAAAVRSRGSIAVCVAASALAAMLLTGGKTAHSEFHIPIPSNDTSMCYFTYAEKQLLRRADLIIWDECSMIHCDTADTVERSLRDVMQDQRPFGGKTVVLMGDFKQLLPVVRYGSHVLTFTRSRSHVHTFTRSHVRTFTRSHVHAL
jgi:ATP-dependent DNA helicase PIF1